MDRKFECSVCISKSQNQQEDETDDVLLEGLERVDSFCYLGDTINGDASSELAVIRRVILVGFAFNNLRCTNTWNTIFPL